jgi:hypothetical protein
MESKKLGKNIYKKIENKKKQKESIKKMKKINSLIQIQLIQKNRT